MRVTFDYSCVNRRVMPNLKQWIRKNRFLAYGLPFMVSCGVSEHHVYAILPAVTLIMTGIQNYQI